MDRRGLLVAAGETHRHEVAVTGHGIKTKRNGAGLKTRARTRVQVAVTPDMFPVGEVAA
jgi:hypothetical protein